ncbi:hypothetical protein WHZ78_07750 [Bradyrhizobium symbiodeficiens]|uniref:hypothetical protein n=1 Tax=Bradyrhizobium symbiodeficiens TaxID=1404367 RepID=UPI0030CE1DBC
MQQPAGTASIQLKHGQTLRKLCEFAVRKNRVVTVTLAAAEGHSDAPFSHSDPTGSILSGPPTKGDFGRLRLASGAEANFPFSRIIELGY